MIIYCNYYWYIDLIFSQELIVDFHEVINQFNPNYGKQFEEIIYCFLEDIQKYKKDIKRLEESYKMYHNFSFSKNSFLKGFAIF